MKSILLYTTLPPVGGNTTITLGLSQFFRKHGLDVCILIRPQENYSVSSKMVDTLKALGCKVILLSDRKSNTWMTSGEAIIKARSANADIFISIGMGYVAPLLAMLGKFRKKYFYYINHDPKVTAVKKLGKLLNAFDGVLAISAVSIAPIKVFNQNISIFWLPQFSEIHASVDACKRDNIPTGRRFGFIGAFKKSKGILTLLQMWASKTNENDDKLLILGDGEEREAVDLAAQTNTNIIYKGSFFATERETVLPHFFSEIDYLLVPSQGHGEGIPTVILEALSMGIPVISTKGGGTIVFEEEVIAEDFAKCVKLVDEHNFVNSLGDLDFFNGINNTDILLSYNKWFSDETLASKWLNILD